MVMPQPPSKSPPIPGQDSPAAASRGDELLSGVGHTMYEFQGDGAPRGPSDLGLSMGRPQRSNLSSGRGTALWIGALVLAGAGALFWKINGGFSSSEAKTKDNAVVGATSGAQDAAAKPVNPATSSAAPAAQPKSPGEQNKAAPADSTKEDKAAQEAAAKKAQLEAEAKKKAEQEAKAAQEAAAKEKAKKEAEQAAAAKKKAEQEAAANKKKPAASSAGKKKPAKKSTKTKPKPSKPKVKRIKPRPRKPSGLDGLPDPD